MLSLSPEVHDCLLIRAGKRGFLESLEFRIEVGCRNLSDGDAARRSVIAAFDGGWMSSEGGTLPLPEANRPFREIRPMVAWHD